jgi:hypothetical protein
MSKNLTPQPEETPAKSVSKASVLAKTSLFLGCASFLCFISLFRLASLPPFLATFLPLFILLGVWFCTAAGAVATGYYAGNIICADDAPKGRGWAWAGMVTGCANLIAILAVMAIPHPKPRLTAAKNPCINNLRQLAGAKEQWALDNKKNATATPGWADIVGTDKYIKIMPQCPAGGRYTLGSMEAGPICSRHPADFFAYSLGAHTVKKFAYWRLKAAPVTCQQSLALIRLLKQQCPQALTEKDLQASMSQFYPNPPILRCEAGGIFIFGRSNEAPKCSISGHTLR